MTYFSSNITVSGSNPDKASIQRKKIIDISLNSTDVSASNAYDDILLNYTQTEITIINDKQNGTKGDVYYTPLYTEKINYSVWKRTIDKSFKELEAI